jgi:hypothetical protein
MQPIYIAFIIAIGIIIAIGVGMQLSSSIDDFTIYVLFWMLYIITIATFINIFLVGTYYINMKDKTGPPGKMGPSGEQGDTGETGLCDPTCRDSICENQVLELITEELKKKNQGVAVRFNNSYIKSKVRQMCASNEFKQLAPYNGPQNLINYLKDIWKIWVDLLYEAGGMKYYEIIGGETEFDWVKENPFNEMKKYDVFYWGMGKQYRPMVKDKCYKSNNGDTPDIDQEDKTEFIKTSPTTFYEYLGNNDDTGSQQQVSFWRAKQFTYKGSVYYPLGDIAIGPNRANEKLKNTKYVGNIKFPYQFEGPNRETLIVTGDVKGPIDYELIWTSQAKGNKNNFWIWRPIAPVGYICLGDVVTYSERKPNTNENAPIRCVPKITTIRLPTNGKRLWVSTGVRTPVNLSILGFVPNDKKGIFTGAMSSNAYNLFRGVVGLSTTIPESDINGSFYYLDANKYYSDEEIGKDTGTPEISLEKSKVGKGYIFKPPKDSKYSILSYINLKNNASLKHNMSNIIIDAQLVPNAISNAYLISINGLCLNYNGVEITRAECDELSEGQIFSLVFTGNKKGECKIQHYKSGKVLKYKDSLFNMVNITEPSEMEYQLFTMQ